MDLAGLKTLFQQEYGVSHAAMQISFAPGRVNLIGEYTDFNGGYVFPAALSLGIYGILRLRSDNLIQLRSTNALPAVTVDLNKLISYNLADGWANYPKGVIKYLLDSGYSLPGCDILFSGNLPDGAGLSSSAAILVLTAFMLRCAKGEKESNPAELARFCQKIENEFIKVNCGIMDQFSVAAGKQDCAILLDCNTLEYEYIPFNLEKYSLVIINTNKKRELTDSKYNERRRECEQAVAIISQHRPLNNLCQATLDEVEKYLENQIVRQRARHVVGENNRVLMAVACLKEGKLMEFGSLLTQSHLSLKDDFQVTGPELDSLVHHALQFPGCIGARMTGAGFGGCSIALVESGKLEEFKIAVTQGYQKDTGLTPSFYQADIADGVKNLESSGVP